MALLIDLFGYLSVVVHGLVILAQSVAIGSILFLVLLVRPLGAAVGPDLARRVARLGGWAALGLVAMEAATVAMQVAVIVGTVGLPVSAVIGANFAVAGIVKTVAALLAAMLLFRARPGPSAALIVLSAVMLLAATLTTHALARLDDRLPLAAVEFLHQFGAALWIGGIPVFVLALARAPAGEAWTRIGARFSRLSMIGVACIVASGVTMWAFYVGDLPGFYGTAYGVMVGAKIAMLLMLLALGGMNFLLIRHAGAVARSAVGAAASLPSLRLRRFAEAEIGIGITVFFAAASLTSVAPAVDLTIDRVTWPEIVARNTPEAPRLVSPDHDVLALPALQARLDEEAATKRVAAPPAFVPGSGDLPPRNAADIAWSEYNHHWAGVFVAAIGILALLNQAGMRLARHWPLLFLGLAVFLFLRSDPEVWPLGVEGFFASLRDVEVLQHRVFVLLVAAFGLFEWRVRAGGWRSGPGSTWAPLVFPLVCAAGGALLLTHQHAIANVKDQLLIELTHTPLALAAVGAGWSRWLELRLDPGESPRVARIAGWTWPVCLLIVGVVLLLYREA